ncbi:MAG: hypothetical protein RO469_13470 [Thermincola sp.]|nr:hypothetical protein [Thermincola sp.]MDT3703733.1 hypothetical protein [Thermincola sp.]
MQKFVNLVNQIFLDWRNAFNLNHDWQGKIPSTIAAALALSTLNDVTPQGYYLARQKLQVRSLPLVNQELFLQGEIIKTKANLINCHTSAASEYGEIVSLSSTLIKTGTGIKIATAKTDPLFLEEPKYRRSFTHNEVKTFSFLSGDKNVIHSGDNPVVQGMLILLILEDYLAAEGCFFENVDVRFYVPVRINETVNIYISDKNICGIVDEKVNFKVEFKEENSCPKN